jgi:RND family efflux transporter MFP subunit
VNAGDRVKADQVLATIDPTSLQLQTKAAEAQFQAAEAQLANVRSINERQTALLQMGVTPPSAQEDAANSLAAAQSNWKSAKANLDKAKIQQNYAKLVADYDGIVLKVDIKAGQFASSASSSITIARPDQRDAVIDVPEVFAARLKTGQKFLIRSAVTPDISTVGTVREIAPNADNSTHTQRIYIGIEKAPINFRIGSLIEAAFEEKVAMVIPVPGSSVFEEGGDHYVWIVNLASTTTRKTRVEIGESDSGYVAIRAGLKPGDQIVAAGVHSLKDNEIVKPVTDGAL